MAVVWKKLAYDDDVILKAFIAAKGDTIAATGNDAPIIVSVGADDEVLTADSAQASGVKWAVPAGGASTLLALTDTPSDYTGYSDKALVVNGAENAIEFADPIPKATDWKGNFSFTTGYGTTETDISALFSTNLALTTRRKYSVKLDLTNIEADGNFTELYLAVKEKIDGTNYRAIDRKIITKANILTLAEPGIIIDIPATSENIQITMKMVVGLAANRTIYYAVVKEHLE